VIHVLAITRHSKKSHFEKTLDTTPALRADVVYSCRFVRQRM
jgi:hypothetical protein